jgi:hypothetical protein
MADDGAVDPLTIVLILVLAGGISVFVALRRAASEEGGSRVLRSSDPLSMLVGLVLVGAALAVTYLLVLGR